mmetsp:Transcript_12851/g.30092  ORF Transcript_12851/g.30092 Transcript_12851/m.30092 type:complete len:208 (+) Transcript_12851:1900-2523(+)
MERKGQPVLGVAGIDPDHRALAAEHVRKGRTLEHIAVQPVLQVAAVVQATGEQAHQIARVQQAEAQAGLAVTHQHLVAEILQALGALQAEVSRRQRPAGHTGHKAHVIEQAVAPRRGQLAQPLQHAVGKGRRAQPAAREAQRDHVLAGRGGGRTRHRLGHGRLVARRVQRCAGTSHQHQAAESQQQRTHSRHSSHSSVRFHGVDPLC